MAFVKAVKTAAKLRLAITGPSGAGKTYTALNIAKHLTGGDGIALVDTEHGSAAKYADIFQFDVLELRPPYHPDRFGEAIAEAAKAGYKVVILDSLTHAWSGTGGMLDIVDEIARRNSRGGTPNTFAAWKDGTPIQQRLIESIVGAPIHVIATMRSKQDTVQEKDERTGKTVIRKVGMTAQQREGFEYEFDVVLDLDIDHVGTVTKSRAVALADHSYTKPGKEVADLLNDWLEGAPAAERKAEPQTPPPPTSTNGNGNGRKAELDAKTTKHLHAAGVALFGQEWDTNRARLVKRITKGRTESSKELTPDEARTLIEFIEQKQREWNAQQQQAAAPAPDAEGNPFAEQPEVEFGMGDKVPPIHN